MTQANTLTLDQLNAAVAAVATSRNDDECAEALLEAAMLLQHAALNGGGDDLIDLVDQVPDHLGQATAAVLDRAVSVHQLPEGGSLSMWLLPVSLEQSQVALLARLPLEGGVPQMNMAAALQTQLGLDQANGWVYVAPQLISDALAKAMPLPDLLRYPHAVRRYIRGETKGLPMLPGDAEPSKPGVQVYYLPFVAYHDKYTALTLPNRAEQVAYRLTKWVESSTRGLALNGVALACSASSQPQVMHEALVDGARLQVLRRASSVCQQVAHTHSVAPKALAIRLAAYVDSRDPAGGFKIGLSFATRLENRFISIGIVELMADMVTPDQALDLAHTALKGCGVEVIQRMEGLHSTQSCACCNALQLMHPTPVGLDTPSESIH